MAAELTETATLTRRLSRRMLMRSGAVLSVSVVGLAALTGCGIVPQLGTTKMPRIGYLSPGPREAKTAFVDSFLEGLRSLGYVEGQTIEIVWRFTPEGSENQFATMAAELAALQVDLIVTDASTAASHAVKRTTSTIPILAVAAIDPVATGLVSSLARPGGNLTALSSTAPGLSAKWLELLREIVPSLKQPAVLVWPDNPADVAVWNGFSDAAKAAGVQAQRVDLQSATELDSAFQKLATRGVDAVVDAATSLLLPIRARFGQLTHSCERRRKNGPGVGIKAGQ